MKHTLFVFIFQCVLFLMTICFYVNYGDEEGQRHVAQHHQLHVQRRLQHLILLLYVLA